MKLFTRDGREVEVPDNRPQPAPGSYEAFAASIKTSMDRAAKLERQRLFNALKFVRHDLLWQQFSDEIAALIQQWEDMEKIKGYPHIDFPFQLPRIERFPFVGFEHHWDKKEPLWNIAKRYHWKVDLPEDAFAQRPLLVEAETIRRKLSLPGPKQKALEHKRPQKVIEHKR